MKMVKRVLIIALAVIAGLAGTAAAAKGAATETLSKLQARREGLVAQRTFAEGEYRLAKYAPFRRGGAAGAKDRAAKKVKSLKKQINSLDKKIAKAKGAAAQ